MPTPRIDDTPVAGPASDAQIERIARRRASLKMGWYVHAGVYLAVNLLLAAAYWFGVEGGRAPRAPFFPLAGWGLGLAIHFVVVFALPHDGRWHRRMVERERRALQGGDRW